MERYFTIAKTGWVAAIPFVFGIFGSLSGGRLCDYLVRRGVPLMASRKWPMVIALLGGSLFTALAAIAPGNELAIGFISIAMFLLYIASSAAWAMAPAAAPGNSAGSLGAVQNFGGFCGGMLAPTVTGFIVQETTRFAPALHTGAAHRRGRRRRGRGALFHPRSRADHAEAEACRRSSGLKPRAPQVCNSILEIQNHPSSHHEKVHQHG
jgi:MFS family permease